MKKKFWLVLFAVLTSLCMVLSLAGCSFSDLFGGSKGSGNKNPSVVNPSGGEQGGGNTEPGQSEKPKPDLPIEGYDENGLYFKLNSDGESYSVFQGAFNGTSLVIPSTFNNAPVTVIGEQAFALCELKSVIIPESVTSIGSNAFFGCSGLETVIWNAENCTMAGTFIFEGCTNLSSVTFGEKVKTIPSEAFRDCSGLTEITIPDSVTSIGGSAFEETAYYNDDSHWTGDVLYIGNHLIKAKDTFSGSYSVRGGTKTIAGSAFYDCSGLTQITIPDSVTSIGDYAFRGCSGLTSVTIGSGVTSIGSSAFSGCSSIKKLEIPDSVTSIGERAFASCRSLNSIKIPDSVTSIGDYAFYGCSGLTSVTIGSGVTSIGVRTFEDCSGLTSIAIPDSVTSIGMRAFSGTAYYNDDSHWMGGVLYIGNHLIEAKSTISGSYFIRGGTKTIAGGAFGDCSGLTQITIPDSVTSIGDYAFGDCSGLTEIAVDENNQTYHARGNCLIETKSKTLIAGCKTSQIPEDGSVTSIGDFAFYGCSGLTSIAIPNSVTLIGKWAFAGCSGLNKVHISDLAAWCRIDFVSVEANPLYYAQHLYLGGVELTNLTIPSGIKEIKAVAFYNCSELTSVTIPDSVTSIGERAFASCRSLNSIKIPDSVTSIGDYAFEGCSGLNSIKIPDSVTSIGARTFEDCSGLTSIAIPDSVTSIGMRAFSGTAYYNDDSHWTGGVLHIGNHLIKAKSTISGSYFIRGGTKTIADEAFVYCSGLTSVTIPDSVTSIGDWAFMCSGLTSVTIPDSVTSIGDGAFYGCSGLKEAYFENPSNWNASEFGNPTTAAELLRNSFRRTYKRG